MSNAIERAIEFFTALDKGKHIHGIPAPTGIIAELTAHKAKLDNLKGYLQEIIQDKIEQRQEATSSIYKNCMMIEQSIYENFLTKLEELEAK